MFFLKAFFNFFQKKPPKMSSNMTKEQINSRLVEIYQSLNRIQELADVVMYNPFLGNAIKEVFLNWYESKLDALKEELFEYTNMICVD